MMMNEGLLDDTQHILAPEDPPLPAIRVQAFQAGAILGLGVFHGIEQTLGVSGYSGRAYSGRRQPYGIVSSG